MTVVGKAPVLEKMVGVAPVGMGILDFDGTIDAGDC